MTDIRTMNLGDAGDGMVPIDPTPKLEPPCVSLEVDNILEDKAKFIDDVNIFIDPKASFFLIGTEMDYEENELESGFKFKNPNEKSTCGCGESFSV